MKRFHVHVAVEDLDRSIAFYAGLFGAPPTVRKHDYAKWLVDDPRLNFAISQRGGTPGVDHLGLQADSADDLEAIRSAFTAADASAVVPQDNAMCCYVRSDKLWLTDPQGITWEGYHSLAELEFFAADGVAANKVTSRCCGPALERDDEGAGEATAAATSCCAGKASVAGSRPRQATGGG